MCNNLPSSLPAGEKIGAVTLCDNFEEFFTSKLWIVAAFHFHIFSPNYSNVSSFSIPSFQQPTLHYTFCVIQSFKAGMWGGLES